ncbi:MAG: 16S rRNA (guanine(527)-N(7))-methyltransferase RsmG [Candidatus Fimenecus sp.]
MKKLEAALKKLGLKYDANQLEMLEEYMQRLLIKNKNLNLTAIKERDEFINKHYIDSLVAIAIEEFQNAKNVIDIGTGGGFPGVPLAIFAPDKEFLLLDSLAKRLNAVMEITHSMGITNINVVHGRAEDLAKKPQYRERFDLCVSRAVAPLATLSEYCLPFVKVGGNFVAYKTVKATDEVIDAKKAIMLMGGTIKREESDFPIPVKLQHTLLIINKNRMTPLKYPRKAGTPAKSPILQKDVSRETLEKRKVIKNKNRGGALQKIEFGKNKSIKI